MSLMKEYIDKLNSGWGIIDLENELQQLIISYNKYRNSYLFIYTAAISKQIPMVSLVQDDFYIIHDLLKSVNSKNLDFYIETPGGSGETAEEIARFLHKKFENNSFIISGEAKSAGTILTLSADEIYMTDTASLGPIDAQMKIGRSVISAHDYIFWINEKKDEAEKNGRLNPFDATMIAQITPGELNSVYNALKFAEDLVIEWIPKHKFKNWNFTETRKIKVTDKMKTKRAQEIANELTNHTKWRSHGRSLKISDLENIGLKINRIENDRDLCDIVYRIQTICRLIFESSTTYKIFYTENNKIFKQAIPSIAQPMIIPQQQGKIDAIQIDQKCPRCGKIYKLYAKFINDPKIDDDFSKKGFTLFPQNNKINCDCGFNIDLQGVKNDIESKVNKKII